MQILLNLRLRCIQVANALYSSAMKADQIEELLSLAKSRATSNNLDLMKMRCERNLDRFIDVLFQAKKLDGLCKLKKTKLHKQLRAVQQKI